MGVVKLDHVFTGDDSSQIQNIPVSDKYLFYAFGTFDGGCVSLEASPDGLNWFTVDQLTETGRLIRYLVTGEHVRLKLEGATAPSVTAGIRQCQMLPCLIRRVYQRTC
jgi:hypothetical protein